MLTLKEVGEQTRNAVQLLIDRFGLGLNVSTLNDNDYRLLSLGLYGDLNWEWGLGQFTGQANTFELCLKIVAETNGYPAGIALCAYRIDTKTFEIYMIENFVKVEKEHPLYRRMALFTFMAAYIFTNAIHGTYIAIIEPAKSLIDYYATFGFSVDPMCHYRMMCKLYELLFLLVDIDLLLRLLKKAFQKLFHPRSAVNICIFFEHKSLTFTDYLLNKIVLNAL